MSDVYSYVTPRQEVKGRSMTQRTVILNMAAQSEIETSTMRFECVIFYVDPKSVGSLNFLGKERVRFLITNEHSSLPVFSKKFMEFAGLKAEAEKRGLGSSIELKFCRLEKGRDGSKAFAINTQQHWDEERPLLSASTSSLQGNNLFI